VDLDAQPFHLEIELLLQPFDKSLADVAKRSDVIGEDAHRYAHGYMIPLFTGKEEEPGELCERRFDRGLWLDLLHEPSLVGRLTVAFLEYELADPGAGIQGQGGMA
jgi:hypothetical protein